MQKRKKKKYKHRVRMFFAFIIFGGITGILGYNLLCNIFTIREMSLEKKALKEKIVNLKNTKEELKNDIKKLEDSDYIAKYVREKYYYSKDGEYILKMDD